MKVSCRYTEYDGPVHVVFLGKQRYCKRPSVALFLEAAAERGHTAILLDRDPFLAAELDDVDVVLAKSHYKDGAVRERLQASGVRVVNDLAASAICASRRRLAERLFSQRVPTPPFLRDPADHRSMVLPWIGKPDRGGDHQLSLFRERPTTLNFETTFYQQWLPTREVMKVYSIGRRHELVKLTYSSAKEIIESQRTYAGPALAPWNDAAQRVADATGLEVFNTDLIVHDGEVLAIDVNPFPALEAIPYAHQHLWDLVESK